MATDLCVYSDVKARLRLSNDNDQAILAELITACSEDIREEANRTFDVESYDEFYSGAGGNQRQLWTRQWPLVSVASLAIDGESIPQSPDGIQAGYVFQAGGGKIVLRHHHFRRGIDNIELQYSAGYATVPPDLNQACIKLVMFRFKSDAWTGMKSKAMAGETTTFDTSHMPSDVLRVVQRYKRVIPE